MKPRVVLLDGVLPLLLGIAATLGFAPFGWYPLTLLALAGYALLAWNVAAVRAAWRGWLFGAAHFCSGIYWVFISTHYYGGAPFWLGVFLVAALTWYMALYPAAVAALLAGARRLPASLRALVLLPAAWIFAELFRGWLGTGFPWLATGYAFTDSPLQSLAPLIGVYGLSGLVLLLAGALLLLVMEGRGVKLLAVGAAAAVFLLAVLLPPPGSWTEDTGAALSVGLIQGNISQDQKWRPENRGPTLNHYQQLTRQSSDSRLIIWPEVAIPAFYHQVKDNYLRRMDAYAKARGITLITGLLRRDEPGDPMYNTVVALGADTGIYYKRHLVPFGEFFPLPGFLDVMMGNMDLHYSNFAHGPADQPMLRAGEFTLGLSICFEDAFGSEIRQALPEADYLVNLTNDAWFADSTAPHQHLQIARMRAIETGRYLLRVANTGITTVIGPDGELGETLPQFEVGVIQTSVPARKGMTPYARWGDAPLWVGSLLILLGLLIWQKPKS